MTRTTMLRYNERLILDAILHTEPVQRSQLHSQIPLTQPSVHRIIDNLIEKNFVLVGKSKTKGPGKPSPELHLNRVNYYSVGVVVNTDAISICLANLACETISEAYITGKSHNPEQALEIIQNKVQAMLQATTDTTKSELVGICFSISGYFTSKQNQINAPLPLQEWITIDLKETLSHYFQVPIFLENNATSSAIGESLLGVGRWAQTFVYLSFDYGFGGGVIIDGKPFRGAFGNAMEIGAIYNEKGISKRPALELLMKQLQQQGIDIQTIAELRSQFDPNWPGVEEWIEQVLPQLNQAIWAIRATIDPEVIVLGGKIPKELVDIFIQRVSSYPNIQPRYGIHMPSPKIVYTEVPNPDTAFGAAIAPLKAQFFL